MACSCQKRSQYNFVWTDGTNEVVYPTEMQAKAKVIRKGGSYTKVQK